MRLPFTPAGGLLNSLSNQLLLAPCHMDRDRNKDRSKAPGKDSASRGHITSYYECIFCKRGLSTAQALGGHMNIHRKDRSKIHKTRSLPPPPPCTTYLHPVDQQGLSTLGRLQVQFLNEEGYLQLGLSVHACADSDLLVQGLKDEQQELDLELRLGH